MCARSALHRVAHFGQGNAPLRIADDQRHVRYGSTPVLTEEQALGVVQPPLAASLYSAWLTCVPQAVP